MCNFATKNFLKYFLNFLLSQKLSISFSIVLTIGSLSELIISSESFSIWVWIIKLSCTIKLLYENNSILNLLSVSVIIFPLKILDEVK